LSSQFFLYICALVKHVKSTLNLVSSEQLLKRAYSSIFKEPKLILNKMKKVLPLFSLVSAFAVMLSCQPKTEQAAETTTQSESSVEFSDLKVAFVLTDSVINKYEYFKTKSAELQEKGKKFESDLQGRARGFEQEVANFQQTGGNMTPNQQRAKQEELVKKEQNLMTYRDNLMQELAGDESTLYSEVYDKVQAYLKKYAEENDLDLILSYTRGGAVWYGKDALDLTDKVVEGLNQEFASEKPAAQ
jgi:outer membrane protein